MVLPLTWTLAETWHSGHVFIPREENDKKAYSSSLFCRHVFLRKLNFASAVIFASVFIEDAMVADV